jgi:glycosyltransferase involved in cell wall biosynthesis
VHVTGGVPDVRPYLEQAGIFVCPLRYGTGVKNKLLAALAMRKPAVATRRSLEGLELRADEHVLVADEPADFAAQTVRLMDDADLARRLAESGRSFVERRYSWDSSAKELEGVLERAVRQGRARASEPATQGT